MEFTLNINCDNAAFAGGPLDEVATILDDVARRIRGGDREGSVRDTNGNTVGGFELAGEPDEDNEDQDEAENICQNEEHLYDAGRMDDPDGLEAMFRAHVAANALDVDPDNVDYTALARFLQE